MSPSSLPINPRAARLCLAATLLMTVWLAATPARCEPDPGPGATPPAASTLAEPAWHWLRQVWAQLRNWPYGALEAPHPSPPAPHSIARSRHGARTAGSSAEDDGGSGDPSGGSSGSGTGGHDPNG